jgi:hypothetical protein
MSALRATPAVVVASKSAAGLRSAPVRAQAMLANQEDTDDR